LLDEVAPVKIRRVITSQDGNAEELWAEFRPEASRRILTAALDAFAAVGFHAATTRQIGEGAGMSPAGVYVHFRAKEDLLFQISRVGHEAVLRDVERAIEGASNPTDRLRSFALAFTTFHARNHTLTRVIQYELRALPRERLHEIAAIRQRFEDLVEAELEKGNDAGEFHVADVPGTALAILSLGIDVARWYTPRAAASPEELAELYAGLVLRMVGAG
jgi:AcrR family transcriptional regulator